MERKNDLCERLLQFAVDVILYLRTVKNTIETMDTKRQIINSFFLFLGLWAWNLGLGTLFAQEFTCVT